MLRCRAITPPTVSADSVTIESEKVGNCGRPFLKIPVEVLEELRGLGFTWSKIAEMIGVSRWTIYRRVTEYGLEDMRGYDNLPDEGIDQIISGYISNHGSATGYNFIAGFFKSGSTQKIPRINQALYQFTEAFNHHNVRTERNWSSNQMWLNGMMQPENPLSNGELDEEPYDFEYYGE